MLKHPAECALIVHTQTHSAGCRDSHAVSLSSVRAIVHYTPILSQYDPALKEEAENQIKLSEELAEEWTSDFMFSNDPKSSKKGSEVADYLSNHDNFLSHNRRISRGMIESETPMSVSELEENQDLQDAVLSAFHAAIATHSHQRYAKIIENQHGDVYARNIEG